MRDLHTASKLYEVEPPFLVSRPRSRNGNRPSSSRTCSIGGDWDLLMIPTRSAADNLHREETSTAQTCAEVHAYTPCGRTKPAYGADGAA